MMDPNTFPIVATIIRLITESGLFEISKPNKASDWAGKSVAARKALMNKVKCK